VVAVGAAGAAGAERGFVSHQSRHERYGNGAGEGGDPETCLRHRVDRLEGRLPLVGDAPRACWGRDLGETGSRN
jgi:hypothetical protein